MRQWFMLILYSDRELVLGEIEENPKFNNQTLEINMIVLQSTVLHGFFMLSKKNLR